MLIFNGNVSIETKFNVGDEVYITKIIDKEHIFIMVISVWCILQAVCSM